MISGIGKRIIDKRKEFNMTQDELARTLQISRSAISLYELDRREPNAETLIKLADFFNVSSDYLLGISSTSSPSAQTLELTEAETKLLDIFKTLNNDNKIRATARLLDLQQEQSFTKDRQAQKSSTFQRTKKADKIS